MGYYSEIARSYNELHGEEQRNKAAAILRKISPKGLLLDIGAGTGISTAEFARSAECIALDPSIEMLRQFSGMKVVGRAEQLPFRSGSFDTVVSLTALHHANLKEAWKEIRRVSRKNAQVAISFFRRAANFRDAQKIFAGFERIEHEKDAIFIGSAADSEKP